MHADETREDKVFAPGYGEFRTAGGGDLEAMALAIPADAISGPVPPDLLSLAVGAGGVLESERIADWESVNATIKRMNTQWQNLKGGALPPLVAERMTARLSALTRAVQARKSAELEQAAIDVGQSVLDLELQYRDPTVINTARFQLWTQQLRVDAAAKNAVGVAGDVAVLEWIRDRISAALPPAALAEIDTRLHGLSVASDARNLVAAADHAARLGGRLRHIAAPGTSGWQVPLSPTARTP
jgi:hypothetical protein